MIDCQNTVSCSADVAGAETGEPASGGGAAAKLKFMDQFANRGCVAPRRTMKNFVWLRVRPGATTLRPLSWIWPFEPVHSMGWANLRAWGTSQLVHSGHAESIWKRAIRWSSQRPDPLCTEEVEAPDVHRSAVILLSLLVAGVRFEHVARAAAGQYELRVPAQLDAVTLEKLPRK